MTSPPFQFALPPSTHIDEDAPALELLRSFLEGTLGRAVKISRLSSYAALHRGLVNGELDAAWAPPFVCAHTEVAGARVLARAVRNGRSTYRAALLVREGEVGPLESVVGKRGVWTDPHSVGGHLLAAAHLKRHGLDPAVTLRHQTFAGSYAAALGAVLSEEADLTSIYVSDEEGFDLDDAIHSAAPGFAQYFEPLAFTEATPTDGVVLSVRCEVDDAALRSALIALHRSSMSAPLLHDIFQAEAFEAAPPMSYRALHSLSARAP